MVLVNTGSKAVNLKGYTACGTPRARSTPSAASPSPARAEEYLHTGKGGNTKKHRYWGSGNYMNNHGDKATLKNAKGKTVDTCSYGNKKGRTKIALLSCGGSRSRGAPVRW